MYKDTIKRIAVVAGVIVAIIALIGFINFGAKRWLVPSQIQRVVLKGSGSCSGPLPEEVELSRAEIRRMVFYFNFAIYAGQVTADGCDYDFSFSIYLKDGTRIGVMEAFSPRMKVSGTGRDRYWIRSDALAAYAQELIAKYDLNGSE